MFYIKIIREMLDVEISILRCTNSIEINSNKHLEVVIFHKIVKLLLSSWKTSRDKEKSYQVIFNSK
jgi:hypothetical protein